MTTSRKVIRVFLASPGDLKNERQSVRAVVDEFNDSWADRLNYQVELFGWEDTVAVFGRPQHIINQDLDRCDLFIGMMYKRWGTPPDNSGHYTSGFEEEFERSVERREQNQVPEISIFFKKISPELLADPGPELQKVLDFKNKIIDKRIVLFQEFSTTQELEKLIRKCITNFVNRIRDEDESSESMEMKTKNASQDSGGASNEERGSSPLSDEGFKFLEGLVERIKKPDSLDSLSASDIARFRLLASSISKPINEQLNLGVHDINILFSAYIEGVIFGEKEKKYLLRLGLVNFENENVPFWCWYSYFVGTSYNPCILSSAFGATDDEKFGAIKVLTLLSTDLSMGYAIIPRNVIIESWFNDETSDKIRVAALGYLSRCGNSEDIDVANAEYDKNDHSTSRDALECMANILLRTGKKKEAQKLVFESQVAIFDKKLLNSTLDGLETSDIATLKLGLEHRNSEVRLCSLKALHRLGEVDVDMAKHLSEDSDAYVRNESVKLQIELGVKLSEKEVSDILISSNNKYKRGLLSFMKDRDKENDGQKLFRDYKIKELKKLSDSDLSKKIDEDIFFSEEEYFVRAEKYFKKYANELRRNVDDRFSDFLNKQLQRTDELLSSVKESTDLIERIRGLEDIYRQKFTRQGLDVLCSAQRPEDLERIRTNLLDRYAGASKLDAIFLGKHGEWSDIPLLVNADPSKFELGFISRPVTNDFQTEVAKAITSIAKGHSISDFFSIDMPEGVLIKAIELCPISRFSKISRDVLLVLLDHKSSLVRKKVAALTVVSLTSRDIKEILKQYVSSDKLRYYNVIHWLDLGASMRRDDAKKVARDLIQN